MWIDQDPKTTQPMKLKADSKPHEIDVAPGEHVLYFTDPRAGSKKAMRALLGVFLGAATAGATGGSMIIGGAIGEDLARGNGSGDGYAVCTLSEGDVFRISVKPTRKGAVKVRQLAA